MPAKSLILIVDDNPANRKMLDILLKKDGFDTQTLEDGNNILEVVDNLKPQLILLDIMMPGMDGYQVCEELKSSRKTRDIPVIFLTAKSDSDAIVKGFQVGASDYVTKPFKPVELLARVKTHLQLRQSFEDLKESQKRITELETRNSILAMAGTANHEINQPLTVISGNLYLLEQSLTKNKVSSEQQKYIREINHGVERIKEILERYRNAVELRYQNYAGSSKIVVFEDNEAKK